MLADFFGGLIDLVGDYDQGEANAEWQYLYHYSDSMLALLEARAGRSNVYTLGLDWARKQAFPVILIFTVVP
jgi:hypothetical protein